jgi:CDGSH-type Zn-finger protein
MATPEIGGRAPIFVEVTAGESYWWCACGRSQTQPFCDGSHASTPFEPIEWIAPASKKVLFCACKRSAKRPLCDGTHKTL